MTYVCACDGAHSQERCSVGISSGVLFPSSLHPYWQTTKRQQLCRRQRAIPPFFLVDTGRLSAYRRLGREQVLPQTGVYHHKALLTMASMQGVLGDVGQTEGGGALPTLENAWDQASVADMGGMC